MYLEDPGSADSGTWHLHRGIPSVKVAVRALKRILRDSGRWRVKLTNLPVLLRKNFECHEAPRKREKLLGRNKK